MSSHLWRNVWHVVGVHLKQKQVLREANAILKQNREVDEIADFCTSVAQLVESLYY
jgi:hypothetical protein